MRCTSTFKKTEITLTFHNIIDEQLQIMSAPSFLFHIPHLHFLFVSAICTYEGGGMFNDAENGSCPTAWTLPSGAGSANRGVVLFPQLGIAHMLPNHSLIIHSIQQQRIKHSSPPPIAAFCLDKWLAVSTKPNSQSSLPLSAAGFCQAETTSGSPLDGKLAFWYRLLLRHWLALHNSLWTLSHWLKSIHYTTTHLNSLYTTSSNTSIISQIFKLHISQQLKLHSTHGTTDQQKAQTGANRKFKHIQWIWRITQIY